MKPKKSLSQNFLTNRKVVSKIIEMMDLHRGNLVLEIGPGRGILTREILKKPVKLLAVEKDRELFGFLKKEFPRGKNLKLIEGDFLNLHFSDLKKDFKLVGNIPYNISGKIFRKIIDEKNKPSLVVLMVQKEVGERIVSGPPKANLLSSLFSIFYKPVRKTMVSRNNFFPSPKVDSAIILLKRNEIDSGKNPKDFKKLIDIIKAGFKQPRKTLLNNLSAALPKNFVKSAIEKLGFSDNIRPADFSVKDWLELNEFLKK